ncbi:hypothetical protein ACP70R_014710 [Stipagrostis hirtigluma subsp. patula]
MALASGRAASLLALVALVSVAGFADPATAMGKSGQVTVFWGRNKAEGTLREACDTGRYTIVIISFLNVFGHGKYSLDLSGHPIAGVGNDIKHCQSKNILVFLSIGGFGKQYSLPSSKSATSFADYLWNAYFLGNATGVHRPFGDAYVDGLDFFIDQGSPDHYDDLARRLWDYNKGYRARTPVQLSATPRCRYPDIHVNRLLATGHVTRINVRFYGDWYRYCGDYWQLKWTKWTKVYPNSRIYLGLAASNQTLGYLSPQNLYYSVLPLVQDAANYGGLMIWDRYADKRTNYSSKIIKWAAA